MFYGELHCHVRSDKDAFINASDLVKRIKEMGGKGCAITDHGVLSSIEDYLPAFKDAGLKMIPGNELYVDGGILGRMHLIVLAKNDNGYKCISKLTTRSNETLQKGFPVISEGDFLKIAEDYAEDIIVSTACMQGVLSSIILQNNKVLKLIKKAELQQIKYINPTDFVVSDVAKRKSQVEKMLEKAIIERDDTKAIAEQRFAKREKACEKAEKAGLPEASQIRKLLEEDKKNAEIAKTQIEEKKAAVDILKKQLSSITAEEKSIKESVENFLIYDEKISELKKNLKTKEELYALAKNKAREYKELFKDNFYIELQYHGIPEETECFPALAKIARELSIPVVATNDVHVLNKNEDDFLRRQILRSIRFDEWKEGSLEDRELYLKTEEELSEMLLKILPEDVVAEAISNIRVIFDKCDVKFEKGKHYPKFDKTKDANELLDIEVEKGIKKKFPKGLPEGYKERLEKELEVIKSMGYADYHLIVKDYIEYGRLLGYVPNDKISEAPLSIDELKEWIKENGWKNAGMTVGPGRGSAVGSLVCYILDITNLDPIKYGLLFERFLNPERVTMPDIDVDFANLTRGKVIEYVKYRYGEKAVCGIMTTNSQAPKGAVRIAAKYFGLKTYGTALTSLGSEIAKKVSAEVGVKFDTMVSKTTGKVATDSDKKVCTLMEYLEGIFSVNKDALEILHWAKVIEGIFTSYGAHAAGIGISDNDDISEYIPLRMNTELGMMTTQCDMVQFEENGLLKFDLLGLKTLDVITNTVRLIEKKTGKIINPLNIDLEDRNVYEKILQTGHTNAVFQLESNGMKSMLKKFKPSCFEDIIILVSMYRPGPMQYLDDVIKVKQGKKEKSYLCKELEPILSGTYAAIVYQEQVMRICQELAGFTLGKADTVRRYMSKKKADKLAKERENFVEGCSKNGISTEVSNEIFSQMEDFAKYAFNKSHAAAYAYIAYITAWLKCYYPAEFYASALDWVSVKKMPALINEAYKMGVKVNAPDINMSEKNFSVKNGEILFGLSAIAGVSNQAEEIIKERNNGVYTSVIDFLCRSRQKINVLKNLVDAGAFDKFNSNRTATFKYIETVREIISSIDEKNALIKSASEILPQVEGKSAEEIIELQKNLGLKVVIKEETTVSKLEKKIENAKKAILGFNEELQSVKIMNLKEDKKSRFSRERELLGRYVTEHPIKLYPNAEEIGCKNIEDSLEIPDDITYIYGIITDVKYVNRKSDGAKMAFFTLSDASAETEVAMFTKPFKNFGHLIEEGNAVRIKGKFAVKDSDNDDEDDEVEYQFIVESVNTVKEKKCSFLLPIKSYTSFHLDIEDDFISEYREKDGHKLYLLDKAMGEIREFKYLVSEKVRNLPECEEINI